MSVSRVAVALSGGVDSSVTAHLLAEAGFAPVGVTMRMHEGGDTSGAAAVAAALGIPLTVIDARARFAESVEADFRREYENGRTPNPCVICNRDVKFPLLFAFADGEGCEKAATGHYARIEYSGGRYRLKKASDATKDQTYMLWNLSESDLSRLLFPLGDYTKNEIREIAAAAGLPSAASKDSQDICFIPDGDYARYLTSSGVTLTPGDYVDESGAVLGRHVGQAAYTVGQRKGLGIALGEPMFVLSRDAAANRVVLGREEALFKKTVTAHGVRLLNGTLPTSGARLEAKVRYAKAAAPALVTAGDGTLTAVFDEPVRAPAPGQSIVLYDGDTVVGGGIID